MRVGFAVRGVREPSRVAAPRPGPGGDPVLCGFLTSEGLQVEADELGRILRVREHDRPVVLMDHPAVVGRHVLLELRRVEPARLLAGGLGDVVIDEVHPVVASTRIIEGRWVMVTLSWLSMTSATTSPTWSFISVTPHLSEAVLSDL